MFKNEEGFSLLELVVAVGVAGIIAAVALPTFAGLQDKASQTSATYAASASAAEALANSTIGGVNGTISNNSSYTGGSSSSSAAASSSTTQVAQLPSNTFLWSKPYGDMVFFEGVASVPAELANGGYVNYRLVLNNGVTSQSFAISNAYVMEVEPGVFQLTIDVDFAGNFNQYYVTGDNSGLYWSYTAIGTRASIVAN